MSIDPEEMREAEELNRAWDSRNLGLGTDEGNGEAIDRLAACDDAPAPAEALVSHLRATLMALPEPVNAPSRQALGIVKPLPTPWPFVSGRRLAAAAALAACLTLIASTGGGFLRDRTSAPTVASVLASPAGTPTVGPTETAWLVSTAVISIDHEVFLAPEIAATVTGDDRHIVEPSTGLTILDAGQDLSGRSWLLVRTSDGRTGWLPSDVAANAKR
jgi:hypothetical protein